MSARIHCNVSQIHLICCGDLNATYLAEGFKSLGARVVSKTSSQGAVSVLN